MLWGMRNRERLLLLTCFGAVYLVWGSTYLALRYAVETIPPYPLAGGRFLAAGILLGLVAWLRDPVVPRLREWRSSALIGLLMFGGGAGSVTWASRRVPSGVCALLVATVPMWIVLLSFVVLREGRATGRMSVGVGLGFVGVASLVLHHSADGSPAVDRAGAAALIFSAMSWALGSLLSRRETSSRHPLWLVAMKTSTGGGFLLAVALLRGDLALLDPAAASGRSLLSLGYLTIVGTAITFTAYVWLLRHVAPARVATYAYVNPVVAVALGSLVGGERLTGSMLAAAAVIVVSVIIVNTPGRAARLEARSAVVAPRPVARAA